MNIILFLATYLLMLAIDIYTIMFFVKTTKIATTSKKVLYILLIVLGIFSWDYTLNSNLMQFSSSGIGANLGFVINYTERTITSIRISFPIGVIIFWLNLAYKSLYKQAKSI